jgi:hypothetical protein
VIRQWTKAMMLIALALYLDTVVLENALETETLSKGLKINPIAHQYSSGSKMVVYDRSASVMI